MRRRIVALLQEHPEGLSPVQTRQLLLKCCSNNAVKPLRAAYNQADKGSGAR